MAKSTPKKRADGSTLILFILTGFLLVLAARGYQDAAVLSLGGQAQGTVISSVEGTRAVGRSTIKGLWVSYTFEVDGQEFGNREFVSKTSMTTSLKAGDVVPVLHARNRPSHAALGRPFRVLKYSATLWAHACRLLLLAVFLGCGRSLALGAISPTIVRWTPVVLCLGLAAIALQPVLMPGGNGRTEKKSISRIGLGSKAVEVRGQFRFTGDDYGLALSLPRDRYRLETPEVVYIGSLESARECLVLLPQKKQFFRYSEARYNLLQAKGNFGELKLRDRAKSLGLQTIYNRLQTLTTDPRKQAAVQLEGRVYYDQRQVAPHLLQVECSRKGRPRQGRVGYGDVRTSYMRFLIDESLGLCVQIEVGSAPGTPGKWSEQASMKPIMGFSSLEKVPLDQGLFEVPEGYTEHLSDADIEDNPERD